MVGEVWGGREIQIEGRAQDLTPFLTLATKSLCRYIHGDGMRMAELERELRRAEQRGEHLKEVTTKNLFPVVVRNNHVSGSFLTQFI